MRDELVEHRQFSDLPTLLKPNDLLVINDTKVIKARLIGEKNSGGRIEVLIERIESEFIALCHVKTSRGLKPSHTIHVGNVAVRLIDRLHDFFRLEFSQPVLNVLDRYGRVPLPNYIGRDATDDDESQYQTVYARSPGAVAAPTAGLHFDHNLLSVIRANGVQIHTITLHVGAGTFQSLRDENLTDVRLHNEHYMIPQMTRRALDSRQGRCIAVGTTVVRTLEHAYRTGSDVGETSLFIKPGFEFHVVDSMITNFHLPESSLIMLVCAFNGYQRTMRAYHEAVEQQYRFFSYGDAMWCDRNAI